MLDKKETQEVLENFNKFIITEARKNLTRKGINASSTLYDSLDSDVEVFANSFRAFVSMETYGEFVDKGVSGTKVKYNTPYSFRSKGGKNGLRGMPPPDMFRSWIRSKGIIARDKKGRFDELDDAAFAMAASAQKKGFRPTLFISRPFELGFAKLPDELIEAYGLDLENFMEFTLNDKTI